MLSLEGGIQMKTHFDLIGKVSICGKVNSPMSRDMDIVDCKNCKNKLLKTLNKSENIRLRLTKMHQLLYSFCVTLEDFTNKTYDLNHKQVSCLTETINLKQIARREKI